MSKSWEGIYGQTGPGFPTGFEQELPTLLGTGKTGCGAILWGGAGADGGIQLPIPFTYNGEGLSGYSNMTHWPYIATTAGGPTGVGNQKIWKNQYYIPAGVLGNNPDGERDDDYYNPIAQPPTGSTGTAAAAARNDDTVLDISGDLKLVNGKLTCNSADIAGKILYSNKYDPNYISGPSGVALATSHHGMFIHTHDVSSGKGKAYYSHANNWVRLIDEATGIGELSDVDTSGQVNGYVLKYDSGIWKPAADGGGSGGGYWDLSGTKIYSDRPIGVGGPCPESVTVADTSNVLFVNGNVIVKKNITAYYSDERLKTFKGTIKNPIEKIKQLNGYYFVENELAKSLGYNNDKIQVGVSAQEVEKVLPEIVTQAPVGKEYKTVWYEKLTPLLIECVKEQQKQIDELKILVSSLMKK